MLLIAFALLSLGIAGGYATTCQSPRITSSSASTSDAFFHQHSVFIADFVVKCSNDVKNLALYGEVNGKVYPAARAIGSDRFQISWTEEHSKARAGQYKVNIIDEDGYSQIRKALRNNEDYSASLKVLGTVVIDHAGSSKGPYIATETIAVVASIVLFYFAYNWKASLQS